MKTAPVHLLYESAYRGNIIPLTSVCNVACIFCSHKQNPPGIKIYRIPPLTAEQVGEILQFVSPEQKIIIGESVTRITEGEPFTNPQIREILTLIRGRFPGTGIQITTNGTLIDREMAGFLAQLGQVEINLSLNSALPDNRRKLMNDRIADDSIRAAVNLSQAGVQYHGSIVAMPHITGWDDLGISLRYLAGYGAKTIRVFLPGFTKLAPDHLKFAPDLWQELYDYVGTAAKDLQVPVTVEPGLITDLGAVVRGVIKDSPAYRAGILRDDVISTVNGEACLSRVDAFAKIKAGGCVQLSILRGGAAKTVTIGKKPGESSGLVMDYDIDPALLSDMERSARNYRQAYILCSALGARVIKLALQEPGLVNEPEKYCAITVPNNYFGGSIVAAGLLMVSDFIEAVKASFDQNVISTERNLQNRVLLVPAVAFDREGRDLAGNSYLKIEEATGIKVEII